MENKGPFFLNISRYISDNYRDSPEYSNIYHGKFHLFSINLGKDPICIGILLWTVAC